MRSLPLYRFWLRFLDLPTPSALAIGCGVTAYSYDDAINILKQTIFRNMDLPPVSNIVENVDVSTLDQGHVIPNMEPPNLRGVWFPLGYAFER